MKKKLLNLKNLIIVIGLVVIATMLFLTTSSYAATGTAQSLGTLMRQTVSSWYRFIVRLSLSIFAIVYLITIVKLLSDRIPDRMATLKRSIFKFLFMFLLITFLHFIMILILQFNQAGVNIAKRLGASLSGINGETDEYDLYETALSKAYEISAVPGFVGLLMYLLLVFYTYKFVLVYAKRYINIIVLMLIAPIMFTVSATKDIIMGIKDNSVKKWFKEYIFNVIVQTLHAIFYATLIGFTLKLSVDNDNLLGGLLALILFGFIFKIDGLFRKIFNFVGGSTNISTSKTASSILDTTDKLTNAIGGKIDSGAGKLEGGMDKLGGKIDAYKDKMNANGGFFKTFGEDAKNAWGNAKTGAATTFSNIQSKFKEIPDIASSALDSAKQLPGKAWEGAKQLPGKAWEGTKNVSKKAWAGAKQLPGKTIKGVKTLSGKALKGAKGGAKILSKKAKEGYRLGKYALSGEGAKSTLTEAEIIEQYHIMQDAKGLEGLRQGIQAAGLSIAGKAGRFGKYTDKKLKEIYSRASVPVKKRIREIQNEYNRSVSEIKNDIRTVKRIPSTIRKIKKKQKYVKTADGLNADVSNIMALVADINPDNLDEVLKEIAEKAGPGVDVSVLAYDKIGPQMFLDSVTGSSIMGLSVLAEARYGELAERQIDETLGNKHEKRKLKKASRRLSRKTLKKAAKATKKGAGDSEYINKVYKFSRFNPDTVRKLNNLMLKKGREQNRYLIVLNKTYEDVQLQRLTVRGMIKSTSSAVKRKIKITRKDKKRSVVEMKFEQMKAVHNYNKMKRRAKRAEFANNVADRAISTKNTIKIGFQRIAQMTPGKVALNRIIQSGLAYHINDDIVVMKQSNQERKVRATGIVKPEEDRVMQLVMTKTGELVKQVVTTDGKIVEPAVDKSGEMVAHEKKFVEVVEHVATNEPRAEETTEDQEVVTDEAKPEEARTHIEEKTVQRVVTMDGKVVEQVINDKNEIESESYVVLDETVDTEQILGAISNDDLGLEETATTETKMQKFEDLLQDLNTQPLLDQVLQEADEEPEMELVEVAAPKKEEDKKYLDSEEGKIDNLDRKVAALSTSLESEVENEFNETVSTSIAEGDYDVDETTGDVNVFSVKEGLKNFSTRAWDIAQELAETRVAASIISETVSSMQTVLENAAEGTLTPEEVLYEKELEKAEKKWAKRTGTQAEKNIAENVRKQGESENDEGEAVKITLKFYGAVETQGQSISLSNRYSIKDYYDRVMKLDEANLEETQKKFLATYGDKLKEMQLNDFTFAKSPVEDMDGWAIYVVSDRDVQLTREEVTTKKADEDIDEESRELLDKYFKDFKDRFVKFVEEFNIDSFDDLHTDGNNVLKLTERFKIILLRKGESNAQEKAERLVKNLHKDIRFKEIEKEMKAKKILETKEKQVKDTHKVKTTKKAEEDAAVGITSEEVEQEKERQRNDLMSDILEAAAKEQEEEAGASEDIRELLGQLEDTKLYIEVDNPTGSRNSRKNSKIIQFPF